MQSFSIVSLDFERKFSDTRKVLLVFFFLLRTAITAFPHFYEYPSCRCLFRYHSISELTAIFNGELSPLYDMESQYLLYFCDWKLFHLSF